MGSEALSCDVVVIGGGVNGTGVARDCALRGLSVVLIERNDLAFGASGNSSGLIHGGPRYMMRDPGVTYTSCLDSGRIQRIAPHLLFRVPVLVPVSKHATSGTELDLVDAFFGAYDKYQPLKRGKPHTRLSPLEVRQLEPGISGDLEGAVTFDEWGIDGVRLCVANARDAANHGAKIVLPASVVKLVRATDGRVNGVEYEHRSTGQRGVVLSRCVVNATGAWGPLTTTGAGVHSARARVRPGKGIHVFLDRRISDYGVMFKAIDGRWVFIEPWQNTSVIGTTDDDYYGDLDNVFATGDETRYLLEATARVLPAVKQARVIGTYAGVRPTLYAWGKAEDALSREHEIIDHADDGAPGLFSMLGGKLASYRLFAEEMSDRIAVILGATGRCATGRQALPGGETEVSALAVADRGGIDLLSAKRLLYRHGSMALQIADQVREQPKEAEVVCACEPVLHAEIRFVVEQEWAVDVNAVSRRTRLGLGSCGGLHCAARCGALLAQYRNESPADGRRYAADFRERQLKHRLPAVSGAQLLPEMLSAASEQAHASAGGDAL